MWRSISKNDGAVVTTFFDGFAAKTLSVYEFHTSRGLELVDRFSHTNLAHRLDSLSMMSMQSMLGYRSGPTWIIDIVGIVGVYRTSMQICRSGP